MNLLAVETATPSCAVGIRTERGAVTRIVDDGRRHTEALTGALRDLLDEMAVAPREIDRVVVDRGPGLFTGLRVGIATAIAFSQALGCELVGVTSLETLAGGAFESGIRGTLVACVDGRRGEIFVQTFALDADVAPVDDPRVSTAADTRSQLERRGTPVTCTGDGVARYRASFAGIPSVELFDQVVPSVRAALSLGAARSPQAVVSPLYLRDADAVANFATRERPR